MLHIIDSVSMVKKTNLVLLLKNRNDLDQIDGDFLEDHIKARIEEIFVKQKNTIFRIYVGKENFEEIIFLFYLDISKNITVFLGEQIEALPESIAFFYNKDDILLDSIILGKYEYDYFKAEKKELTFWVVSGDIQRKFLEQRLSTLRNVADCRDLVNLPSSEKTPEKFADIVRNVRFINTKVKIIGYDEVKKIGLNLLDAVGKGSISKPRMIVFERIIDKNFPTIGLVGKGITFDTGGLNIKTGTGMYGMKDDMAGAATLLYTLKELDEKTLSCNIVCALPLAENAVSGDAFRPGDIIRSYSGKTVEIINTDAEGRLILADGISYISKNYSLSHLISVATLTGACMRALGYQYAGIMGNARGIIDLLLTSPTFEKYWELPMDAYFVEKTKGQISDLVNLSDSVLAGASMGGAFLSQFCLNSEKFVHIDIAGVSYVKEKYGVFTKGATGFGVESLSLLLQNYAKTTERIDPETPVD